MPEVFISNHMKQQKNYSKYKRNKGKIDLVEKAQKGKEGTIHGGFSVPAKAVKPNSLLLVIRIKDMN